MTPDSGGGVRPIAIDELLATIGELYFQNRLLRQALDRANSTTNHAVPEQRITPPERAEQPT